MKSIHDITKTNFRYVDYHEFGRRQFAISFHDIMNLIRDIMNSICDITN